MVRLSVNVNKVATLRNSRGGSVPSLLDAVDVCLERGAPGITVHPRADRRHVTPDDVHAVARRLAEAAPAVEYNIEGDPRPEWLELVHAVKPHQCTLVPVSPGELTSQAGWRSNGSGALTGSLPAVIAALRSRGIRVSVFVDPEPEAVRWAADAGADRIELYTEPFARAFESGEAAAAESFDRYSEMAALAHSLGLGVNAGHDLDLANLRLFRELPFLDEVSIGHALISRALFVGLATAVREYLDVLRRIDGGTVDPWSTGLL
jgi:pyridoxine 5-phosphate synthase